MVGNIWMQRFYDKKRTQVLNEEGFRVLRFWNSDVLENLDEVLEFIYHTLFYRKRAAKRQNIYEYIIFSKYQSYRCW